MHPFETLLAFTLGALIIGLAMGFLISQRAAPSRQSQRQLEEHLQKMQQQQRDYQHGVTEHFEETAQLLNQLTSSYRDVHNHLAKGAQLLASEGASESLKVLPEEGKPNADDIAEEASNIAPPLDYAPKSSPNQPGMLNEEFGLQKEAKEGELESPATALK